MTGNGLLNKAMTEGDDYEIFRAFLEKACGIVLGENKQYLVNSRLQKILKEREFPNLTSLVNEIERQPYSNLKQVIIDAMTTNETLWFRDCHPFDYLVKETLKERAKVSANKLRIWSAACSSGQEPYSLSMSIDEAKRAGHMPLMCDTQIIATDICQTVLEVAKCGRYESLAMGRGLSQQRLKVFFNELDNGEWDVKPEVKNRVEFRPLNLQDSFNLLGKFDIIFCRNVLIYFSMEFKSDILTRIHSALRPGGYLFLGASESLNGLSDLYEMHQYRPGIVYIAK